MEERVGESRQSADKYDPQKLAGLHWRPLPPGELTVKQRGYLKRMAHHLKPVVRIGQEGVTEASIGEMRKQLLAHELVKVKWSGLSKEEGSKTEQARELAAAVGAHYVHLIGQTVILYRELEEKYRNARHASRIQLPQ